MVELPDKPSDLIRLAVKDLQSCIEKNYVVDMFDWYSANDGICSVCIAGAVMAESLGLSPADNLSIGPIRRFSELGRNRCNKLLALNHFHFGYMRQGCSELNIELPSNCPKIVEVAKYSDNPSEFFKCMLNMSDKFESFGL